MSLGPALIVCMGVSGSGKSTLGKLLADSFDLTFIDADDFHSDSNKKRMAAGIPLTDEDRAPWMNELCTALQEKHAQDRSCVLAHSALRRPHRQQIRRLGFRTIFLHLDGSRDLIARRIAERRNHYMPPELLDSQFAALDATDGERDIVKISTDGDRTLVAHQSSLVVNQFIETRTNA